MPPKLSSPPPRMTWGRAVPVLALCVLFDAFRLMFQQFWFFGPALLAVGTSAVLTKSLGSLVGLKVGAAVGIAAGTLGAVAIQMFGLVMAMAVGLLGWATITLVLILTNPRLYKSDMWAWVWSVAGLAVSEIPFMGTLPMLTLTHWRLFRGQIRKDREALKEYNAERERVAALVRARQAQRQAQERLATQEIPEDEMLPA